MVWVGVYFKLIRCLTLRLNKDTTKIAFATYIRDYFVYIKVINVNDYLKDPRKIENNNEKID